MIYRLLGLTVALMLVSMPVFAAYEAHVIGVKAEFSQPKVLILGVEGPKEVLTQTYSEWEFTYRILNIYDTHIIELELVDTFGAHLDVALVSVSGEDYQQKSEERNGQKISWQLDRLERRQKAVLKVKVSTGVKNEKQMFVKPGEYFLNKKVRLSWTDYLGVKHKTEALGFKVTAK